jgi:hypothetical protein
MVSVGLELEGLVPAFKKAHCMSATNIIFLSRFWTIETYYGYYKTDPAINSVFCGICSPVLTYLWSGRAYPAVLLMKCISANIRLLRIYSCYIHRILSRDRVTIDRVWIGNQTY